MGNRGLFHSRRRHPDAAHEPPPQEDWPNHVVTLQGPAFRPFIDNYPFSIIDFWAPWCGPCQKMTARLRQLSTLYTGTVAFGKVNIAEMRNERLAKDYKIMGIPTLLFFHYGEKIASMTGVQSYHSIKAKLDGLLEQFG